MKIAIDLSVHTKSGTAAGVVSGTLEFACVPRVGEQVSFLHPTTESVNPLVTSGFIPLLKVAQILHVPGNEPKVMMAFEDVIFTSNEEAKELMLYLEKGFGLFADFFV
jgi:hypothetical protein